MSELPDIKCMMCHIEALLKDAETFQDTARQREYIKRIDKLTSEVKTNLLGWALDWCCYLRQEDPCSVDLAAKSALEAW